MFDELKQKIEIFTRHEISLIPRQEVRDLDLNLPQEWKNLLDNESYTASEIIKYLWHPAIHESKALVDALTTYVTDIAIITSLTKDLPIQMCYVFQITSFRFQQTYLNSWVAGMPLTNEDLLENTGVEVPRAYEKFCKIHNGFLLNGNFSVGFLPVERLNILASNDGKKNLLCFFNDGLGNHRCFDLESPINENDFITVDLDHETLDTSHPLPFWDFASKFVTANMKVG